MLGRKDRPTSNKEEVDSRDGDVDDSAGGLDGREIMGSRPDGVART
jgi:hypothetical protein